MADQLDVMRLRQSRDLFEGCWTAGAIDVRLYDIHALLFDEPPESFQSVLVLSPGHHCVDRPSYLPVALVVVGEHRLFQPRDVVFPQTLIHAHGVRHIPGHVDVERDETISTDFGAGARYDLFVLRHAVRAVCGPVRYRDFHVANAKILERRRIISRVIGFEEVSRLTAQQIVDRLPHQLPFRIPQGDVDARDSALCQAAAPVKNRRPVELFLNQLGFENGPANHQRAQLLADHAGRRCALRATDETETGGAIFQHHLHYSGRHAAVPRGTLLPVLWIDRHGIGHDG